MFHFHVLHFVVTLVYSISQDCPDVINFALGLKMDVAQPAIMSQLYVDCCAEPTVSCDTNFRVTYFNWYSKGLNGIINATAMPSTMTNIDLGYNAIYGPFPRLPPNMARVAVQNNRINGSISFLPLTMWYISARDNYLTGMLPILPEGFTRLYIYGNFLSGDIPLFPSTLQIVWIGNFGHSPNRFTGTVILNKPTQLYMAENWITNIQIADTTALSGCELSNNPLLGNPALQNLTMCSQNGLYNMTVSTMAISYTEIRTSTSSSALTKTNFAGLTSTLAISSLNETKNVTLASSNAWKETNFAGLTSTLAISSLNKTKIDKAPELPLTLEIQSAETVSLFHWSPLVSFFSFYRLIEIGFRLMVNIIVLGIVTYYTPYKRAIKQFWDKLFKPKAKSGGLSSF